MGLLHYMASSLMMFPYPTTPACATVGSMDTKSGVKLICPKADRTAIKNAENKA